MNRVLGKIFFCVVIFFGTMLFVKLEGAILKEGYKTVFQEDIAEGMF